jgi:hypothetical protein
MTNPGEQAHQEMERSTAEQEEIERAVEEAVEQVDRARPRSRHADGRLPRELPIGRGGYRGGR